MRSADAKLDEAVGLARAIDLDVLESGIVPVADIRPATYIGSGKVAEIAGLIKSLRGRPGGDGLRALAGAAAQSGEGLERQGARPHRPDPRNLRRAARTREGALQVELAHLTYQKSRLVRSWTHLERQRGGFGFLGGPGETQIEADRRLIEERIARIEASSRRSSAPASCTA